MDLRIRVVRDPDAQLLAVQLLVDGQDVVPDGLRGVDPDWILPPLSAALLASSHGRSAMVGTCCEPGCGSFTVHVRRTGERVLWEPDPGALGDTLSRTLNFPILAYLDAVDAAARDPQLQERGRRLARALNVALMRSYDKYDSVDCDVTVPMAWQTGDGHVNLRHRGRLRALPLTDLPEDDAAAERELHMFVMDPQRLPPART